MATKRISATRQQYNIERERAARRIQRQLKVPIKYAREMLPPVPSRVTSRSIAELKNISSKRGKYERNVIQNLYSEYLSSLSPEKAKEFFYDVRKHRDNDFRDSEKQRKKRTPPEKDKQPPPDYPTSPDTTDEIYITYNEIMRIIDNVIGNYQSATPPGMVDLFWKANLAKAIRLKDFFNDTMQAMGREKAAKKLNAAHDRAIEAVWLILDSVQDHENEGYSILLEIFSNTIEENIAISTAQMDTSYDE